MPKATPLNAVHRAAGARMVDFGGWDMPVNYGSQIEEHHAVRRDAGIFDVSHMCVIDARGANVRQFLSKLVANDVARLKTSGSIDAALIARLSVSLISPISISRRLPLTVKPATSPSASASRLGGSANSALSRPAHRSCSQISARRSAALSKVTIARSACAVRVEPPTSRREAAAAR